MKKLSNKVALITGGGTGIGRAISLRLAAEGAAVVICAERMDNLSDTLRDLTSAGAVAKAIVMDQSVEADCVRTVRETVEAFGQLDILVNNAAAVGQVGPVKTLEVAAWEDTMRTNLTGLMVMCREAVKVMTPRKTGCIINVSSNVGRRGFAHRAPYVCSKWAMQGLAQTLALETAMDGIRVNTICPGPVMTDRLKGALAKMADARGVTPEDVQHEWEGQSPMGRFATAEECAAVVLFLASDDASAMTGQAINVTAGMMMT